MTITKAPVNLTDISDVDEYDLDDQNSDDFASIGKKVQIDLADMDRLSWRGELAKDQEILELLTIMVDDITPEHDSKLQEKMFGILGFTEERAMAQFGFLINAFKYGAPPHAGLAFGLDRFVSIMAGLDSIRDCIAFPKNNSGRDVMLDAPSAIDQKQLDELQLKVDLKAE